MQANLASLRRFMKNKLALFGGGFIIILFLLSLIGHKLVPDISPNANNQNLSLRFKKSGYTAYYLVVLSKDNSDLDQLILLDSFYKLWKSLATAVHFLKVVVKTLDG